MRHDLVFQEILNLSNKYSNELNNQINERIEEMKNDDNSHFLIYRVLGITDQEGNLIDIYQNKGRVLYKYAGSFLEESAF
ncbi:MAG: ApaLI family restriction endonuclease, partial [Succinivibrio sp.]|nr:ApaLI family restriction endonuclease [Succinivibrio sp.]